MTNERQTRFEGHQTQAAQARVEIPLWDCATVGSLGLGATSMAIANLSNQDLGQFGIVTLALGVASIAGDIGARVQQSNAENAIWREHHLYGPDRQDRSIDPTVRKGQVHYPPKR